MTAFLDTSILVAVFYGEHEHHAASFELFLSLNARTGCTAVHCLAEVYAVLTGMPGKNRVSPDAALLFLADVRDRLALVSLSSAEYSKSLTRAATLGTSGGGIYDALIAQCALKVAAKALYTWNEKHFTRQGPEVSAIVRRP